ncbi:hypothetical protein FBU59_001173 [Linderina macrospora]|uniref:Uncharacterized protein n=1 Tax=Linderina macrospora TaxID=4868 RepID=A0ACC1JEK2_9FUNG|nr:hypothetical protein FBU59_001173 [Linderina macrospora]
MPRKPTQPNKIKTVIKVTAEDTNELSEAFLKMAQVLERMCGIPLKYPKPIARVRDPLEPKKPMTPYLLFSREHRNEIREADPDAPSQVIAKRVGDAWKNLSLEEREVYVAEHRVLRADYKRRLEAYMATKHVINPSIDGVIDNTATATAAAASLASAAASSQEDGESEDGESSSSEEEEEEEEAPPPVKPAPKAKAKKAAAPKAAAAKPKAAAKSKAADAEAPAHHKKVVKRKAAASDDTPASPTKKRVAKSTEGAVKKVKKVKAAAANGSAEAPKKKTKKAAAPAAAAASK